MESIFALIHIIFSGVIVDRSCSIAQVCRRLLFGIGISWSQQIRAKISICSFYIRHRICHWNRYRHANISGENKFLR